MKKVNSKIYRCSKDEEMYLYLHENKTIDDLPNELRHLVKKLTHILDLELTVERKLSREDVALVMSHLEEKGYHLQMPPNLLKADLYHGD